NRDYPYQPCPLPERPESTGGDTYASIYKDFIADATSVSRCQNSTCHGGSVGQLGLAMGVDATSAYCGVVTYGVIMPTEGPARCPPICTQPCTTAEDDRTTPSCCFGKCTAMPEVGNALALVSIVSPTKSGIPATMPRDICGGEFRARKLTTKEIARI